MTASKPSSTSVSIPVASIADAVEFLRTAGGFLLRHIHPADSPREARMERDGTVIDLHLGPPSGTTINIEWNDPDRSIDHPHEVRGPDGIVLRTTTAASLVVPELSEETSVGSGDTDGTWHVGRAGMEYRDLVPSRLGGALIASNIRIRSAGTVPDYVHHHDVLFQLIFCRRGWVKVVYEDQGEPFILESGDCVIQPPGIRHRVLENSDGMEVVEIGYPAEHMTNVEHELKLPNGTNPTRTWHGQSFVRYDGRNRTWTSIADGIERSDTGIRDATAGLADVDVLQLGEGRNLDLGVTDPLRARLVFVLAGSASVRMNDVQHDLPEGATLCLRSDQVASVVARTDLRLLRVTIDASRDVTHWRSNV